MKKLWIVLPLLTLIILFSGLVEASADLIGMGNAPGAAATGDNAIEWNPAAMNADKDAFFLDLELLNTHFWTNAWDFSDFLIYSGLAIGTDSFWSEDEIDEILAKIPREGFSINFDHTTRAKLIIGPVGFSVGANAYTRGRIDKDFFNLILKGTAAYVDVEGNNTYDQLMDLTDSEIYALGTGDASLTFSFPLHKIKAIKQRLPFDEIYIGSSYHMIAGGYAGLYLTDETRFYIGYDEKGIPTIRFEDNMSIKEKMASLEYGEVFPLVQAIYTTDSTQIGKGAALDLGVYGRKGNLSAGISLMNMGSMTFNNAEVMVIGMVRDDDPNNPIGGKISEEPVKKNLDEPLKIKFPSKFNMGIAYQHRHWLKAGAELSSTKASAKLRYTEIGVGVEFNPIWILPVRLGTNYSFAKRSLTYTSGFGIHLGPLHTDLAVAADFKSASVGFNSSIEF